MVTVLGSRAKWPLLDDFKPTQEPSVQVVDFLEFNNTYSARFWSVGFGWDVGSSILYECSFKFF
jgi:hypothetical protein